jgi:hypothetical protein
MTIYKRVNVQNPSYLKFEVLKYVPSKFQLLSSLKTDFHKQSASRGSPRCPRGVPEVSGQAGQAGQALWGVCLLCALCRTLTPRVGSQRGVAHPAT